MNRLQHLLRLACWALFLLPSESHSKKPWPEAPKRDYSRVDSDTATGRIYVVMDSGIMAKEDSLVSRLIQIAERRLLDKWNGKPIKVALFSEQRFAHPKREIAENDRKGWAEKYLAEYDSEKNEVWIYPALPAKKRKLALGNNPKERSD